MRIGEKTMSAQSPTFEDIRELFRETDRRMQETARQMQETDRRIQETERLVDKIARQAKSANRRISDLSTKIGKIIEHMIRGNIVDQFQVLGYDVTDHARNLVYKNKNLGIRGEVDFVLYNGDIVILIEVKTTLETKDVRRHIERLGEYRRCADAKPVKDNKRYVGAVAGAVVSEEVVKFAHENGLYAIVQSGRSVEIVPPPEVFKAKEW
jgi:hypothetical protein